MSPVGLVRSVTRTDCPVAGVQCGSPYQAVCAASCPRAIARTPATASTKSWRRAAELGSVASRQGADRHLPSEVRIRSDACRCHLEPKPAEAMARAREQDLVDARKNVRHCECVSWRRERLTGGVALALCERGEKRRHLYGTIVGNVRDRNHGPWRTLMLRRNDRLVGVCRDGGDEDHERRQEGRWEKSSHDRTTLSG